MEIEQEKLISIDVELTKQGNLNLIQIDGDNIDQVLVDKGGAKQLIEVLTKYLSE